jgi:DNA-binding transcriptional regulator YiaG
MTPEEIQNLRRRLGLSQKDFAQLVGVAMQSISRWERGVTKPTQLAIARMKTLNKKEKVA